MIELSEFPCKASNDAALRPRRQPGPQRPALSRSRSRLCLCLCFRSRVRLRPRPLPRGLVAQRSSTAAAFDRTNPEPTELPGGTKSKQTTITAKVSGVDAEAGMVTLIGPKGRSLTLEIDPDILAKLMVGDLVSAVYTQAVAASVSREAKK